jgi:hypothetical protein
MDADGGVSCLKPEEDLSMKKLSLKKLTLNRETVRHLSAELLREVQAAGEKKESGCTASTLSCTQ